jgi:hypothetical protein
MGQEAAQILMDCAYSGDIYEQACQVGNGTIWPPCTRWSAIKFRILTTGIPLVKGSRAAKEGLCSSRRDCGDKGMTGFVGLFWKTIRPYAPLTETRSLSDSPQVPDGQPVADERPTLNIERPTSKYGSRRTKARSWVILGRWKFIRKRVTSVCARRIVSGMRQAYEVAAGLPASALHRNFPYAKNGQLPD